MAGFSKIYCIGGEGGFMGNDGLNPLRLQILVGDGNRQWLEARYFYPNIRPIGKVERIVPDGPYHPDALIDACIMFFPKHFRACSLLKSVAEQLKEVTFVDFNSNKDFPRGWAELREEAREYFEKLNIYEAELVKVKILKNN